MADRLSAYADWLVANQNKRGTPEFDTVANAYRQLRQGQPSGVDRSFSSAFSAGIDDPFENMATTARALGMEGTAEVLSGATEAPENYERAGSRFINPQEGDKTIGGFAYEYLPRAAVEQMGQFLGSLTARAVGAGTGAAGGFMVAGPAGAATGAIGGALAGPALFEFVQQLGPIANERARNNGRQEPNWEDWSYSAAASGASGALNAFGVRGGAGAKFFNSVLREGTTEAAQSVVEQTGSTINTDAGLQIDPKQAIGEGIIGGTSAGGTNVAIQAATAPVRLFTGSDSGATDPQGAADLARRLQTIAEANNLDLTDIDKTSTKGAREAVDKAHVQLAEELKQLGRDLRQRLGINDTDELSVVIDKVLAAAGQREARNKTKNTVGKQEFDAIDRLAGDTAEGQQMLSMMRQMNELTELHNSGYQGGVSRITDQFMPFGTNIGYDRGAIATERLLRPLVSGGAAIQTGGASLVGQAALAGAGRAIDAVTGRRSRVKRFVEQNAAKQGIEADPSARSLRAERRQEVLAAQEAAAQEQQRRDQANARTRAMHSDVLNSNTEYPQGSPQQIMSNELGLSPQQLIRALKTLVTDPTYGPAARSAIRSLQRGGRIPTLGLLIKRLQREMAKTTPPATRDRPIVQGQLAAYEAQEAQRSAAVAQGIRDNQALNDQLQAALDADTTVKESDRQIAKSTLQKLRMDLGRDPLQTAEAYLQDALNRVSDPGVVTKYVLPYVERVRVQQNANAASEAPTATEGMSAEPEINQMAVEINQMSGGPALFNYNVFDIPASDYAKTNLDVRPTPEQVKEMREGTFKPEKKRTLVEAAQHLQDRYEGSEADVQPLELTEENLERIAAMMATEAAYNLEQDGNAIGWYDRKLKAAKQVVAIVEPRVLQSPEAEQAFDFALAVTSNGQAVADNFEYALEVFRYFMDNGVMPTSTFIKGGERNASMVAAFDFFNQWNASGQNMSVGQFLDNDYTVRQLIAFIDAFNETNGTDISVPSSEGMNEVVKGSYILGPKIGQGFYQNIRGNYDPLTMDIWWMRMWNRLTGRPFEDLKDEATMQKNRDKIERGMKDTTDPAMKQLIKEALQAAGVKRTGLYKDPAKFDEFIVQLDKAYQRFYKRYKEETGQKHVKPDLFKAAGTHSKNLQKQLQAQPKGPGERSAMRRATKRAIELLQSKGYDINTADFQALMWYPEKQLFRYLGVAPGRGADNDYLDAAKLLAEKEGKTYEQIQEALPAAERDGVDSGTGAVGQDGQADRGSGSPDAGILNYNQPIDFGPGAGDNGQLGRTPGLASSPVVGSRQPTPTEVEQASRTVKAAFEIGKPGSEFENGVPDIDAAKKIAEAINVAVVIADTHGKLASRVGKAINRKISPSRVKSAAGFYVPDVKGPRPNRSAIAVNTSQTSHGYQLFTTLHELGHAFETRPADPNNPANKFETVKEQVYSPVRGKFITLESEAERDIFTDTFRDVMRQVLSVSGGGKEDLKISEEDAQDIIAEVIAMQRSGRVGGESIRQDYGRGQQLVTLGALTQGEVDSTLRRAEATYFHTPWEMAADILGVYMLDPATAKREMPKASRLAQIVFRDNPTIQFFSLPFASIVAMVLANMLVAEGEDEEDMDPGALSMGAGALTA